MSNQVKSNRKWIQLAVMTAMFLFSRMNSTAIFMIFSRFDGRCKILIFSLSFLIVYGILLFLGARLADFLEKKGIPFWPVAATMSALYVWTVARGGI